MMINEKFFQLHTQRFLGKKKKEQYPFRFKAKFCGVFPFKILREERTEK